MIMAVPENDDVKVDSSDQNLDNNTASLAATMRPPSPDDQNPESNSSVETPNSTKGSEGALKSEISHMDVKFSKLNPMAREYVPQPLAPTLPVFVENSLWFTNSFAMQAFSAEDNDLFDTRNELWPMEAKDEQENKPGSEEEVIRRTVHVLDIDQQVTEEQLAGLFQSCGQVVDCRICGDNKSILRLAFIEFTDEGTLFGSYPIQVRLSKTAIAPVNPSLLPKREKCAKTVYCTNIDKKVTQMELEDFFKAACGEIQHVRLIGDCHHQTCIAFVEFKLVESAVSALNCSGIVLGDNNTASLAATMMPPSPDDQNPESNSSVETPNSTKGSEGALKSEISHIDVKFSKLNPMAKEYVPQPLAPTIPVFVENSLWFTNSFAMQAFSAEDNDLFDTRRMNFGQWKRRMSKKTSLAQKEEVIRRTVHVLDIDQQATEEQLAGLFQSCGQVVDCRICGDNKSILRIAFIEFTDEEGARSAVSLSGTLFGSYPIKVRLSKTAIAPVDPSLLPKDEREKCAKTVYCTNIDKKVTQMELEDFFKTACGEIQHVRLIGYCHHQTFIAFVEFKRVESAVSALNCSGIVLGGLPLRVSQSKTPVDSSDQNLDNNTASLAATMMPPSPDDQNPESNFSVETPNSTKGSEGALKSEISHIDVKFSKLNPMAKEYVPQPLAPTIPVFVENSLWFTNSFAMQAFSAEDNDLFDTRRMNFGQWKRRMSKKTSLAQKEEVIRRTVHVLDIDQQATEEQLAGLFQSCGQVVDCRICGDNKSILRIAFIEFTDEEGARSAVSLSGTLFGSYPIKVRLSKTAIAPVDPSLLPKDEREKCAKTVYCTNIDKKVTQMELEDFFKTACGEIQHVRLIGYCHHQTFIAFVEFKRVESAVSALNCSGIVLGGLPLRVSQSKTPVDSSDQNLDNNTASLAATMMPPSPDDQNPESNFSVETPNSTKGSEGALKSEISHIDVKFSKLNPMAKEYVPQPLAPTIPVFVENSLWFTNSFAMQAFSAEDNDLFDTRRMNFGQWKRRMSKKTSLAQKEEVIRRTVHVLDIDQQATEEQLAGLFQSCGQVVDCRICGDNKSILRIAFIEFTDEEGARSAVSLSGTLFGSYPIKVRLSKTAIAPVDPSLLPKDEREKCAKTVYCTNIDKKVTQMELEDFFKTACGEIQHVRLIGYCHHQTFIAFVEFKRVESAVSALNCSGIVLGGLPLRVSQSKTPVDSSDQNLDNNTASLAATMMPPSPDDQNPESNFSVETPNSTKGSEGALKSEISHIDVKFSKLNPMAKEYVPQPLAPTIPVFVENSLWFTNSFAMQAFSAEDNDLFDTRRMNFGQWKRRMSKKTSLAQKEEVIRRTVHVLDIDQQATEEQLAGLFQSCGQVVDCRICGDNKSILRIAFIEFTDEGTSTLNCFITLKCSSFVRLSKTAIAPVDPSLLPKDEREKCAKTVYCTNIDKKVTQMELEDFFKTACGEVHIWLWLGRLDCLYFVLCCVFGFYIQHVRLIGYCHHQTFIAFVEFKRVESAVSALNCSGIVLGGLPLRVSQSKTPILGESLLCERIFIFYSDLLRYRFILWCLENADLKVDSSDQNLDNNTASLAATMRPPSPDDQNPESNSSVETPNSTKGSEGALKSEISHTDVKLMRNRMNFGQWKRRMSKKTSLAQKEEVIRRTVHVLDIDQQATEEQLAGLFQSCGKPLCFDIIFKLKSHTVSCSFLRSKKVVDCRICGGNKSILRLAFIEFTDAVTSLLTVLSLKNVRLSKTAIAPVDPSLLPKDEREKCAKTVYCTNIDKKFSFLYYMQLTQMELEDFFKTACGEIQHVRLVGDCHHQTCIAFVEFTLFQVKLN
ncbi:hypothetical protein HID58_084580 [Brassica napus]|uniref:RRM domain-containing protein n=1 Tax=Brassica napus TaxID=3708 RepID=A0ABQ7XLN5_BRANA|nr:hypothetical protein HID58_084580 [Brassica napus]